MATDRPPTGGNPVEGDQLNPGPASTAVVSLSQVLLAPLDAIFKAQVHAARSFLNLVLQLAYPHQEEGAQSSGASMFVQDFIYPVTDGGKRMEETISLSPLALVPVTPLTVQEASFKLEMAVTHVARHRQIRAEEREKSGGKPRPWFLVDDPISVRGVIAPAYSKERRAGAPGEPAPTARIAIDVKVAPGSVPAGLQKLLTTMTEKASSSRKDAR